MNNADAGRLLDLLCAAYPNVRLQTATVDLWLDQLKPLDADTGERAVRNVIARSTFFPSIAEFTAATATVREQQARAERDRERREADAAADELPTVALKEIPEVVALLSRWSEPLTLEPAKPGSCDDRCGKKGDRFRLGRFRLCGDCARGRLRAAERLAESA